jgi:hypothetical protein
VGEQPLAFKFLRRLNSQLKIPKGELRSHVSREEERADWMSRMTQQTFPLLAHMYCNPKGDRGQAMADAIGSVIPDYRPEMSPLVSAGVAVPVRGRAPVSAPPKAPQPAVAVAYMEELEEVLEELQEVRGEDVVQTSEPTPVEEDKPEEQVLQAPMPLTPAPAMPWSAAPRSQLFSPSSSIESECDSPAHIMLHSPRTPSLSPETASMPLEDQTPAFKNHICYHDDDANTSFGSGITIDPALAGASDVPLAFTNDTRMEYGYDDEEGEDGEDDAAEVSMSYVAGMENSPMRGLDFPQSDYNTSPRLLSPSFRSAHGGDADDAFSPTKSIMLVECSQQPLTNLNTFRSDRGNSFSQLKGGENKPPAPPLPANPPSRRPPPPPLPQKFGTAKRIY